MWGRGADTRQLGAGSGAAQAPGDRTHPLTRNKAFEKTRRARSGLDKKFIHTPLRSGSRSGSNAFTSISSQCLLRGPRGATGLPLDGPSHRDNALLKGRLICSFWGERFYKYQKEQIKHPI